MKKSDYLKLIEYAKNPYLGFLEERGIKGSEVINLAAFCDENSDNGLDTNIADAIREIDELGYCIYYTDGLVDTRFVSESLNRLKTDDIDLIYCDEDYNYSAPFLKPDFSPNTLESFFYLGGIVLVKNDLINDSNTVLRKMNSSSYAIIAERLLYRYVNNGIKSVHISQVYFHSSNKNSYEYPETISLFPMPGEVEKNIKETLEYVAESRISVIILSKDNPKLAFGCIDSLQKESDLTLEYILVDNGSSADNRLVYEEGLRNRNVKYIYHPMEFVYSALCNVGAEYASGEFLLFLNDDILVPEDTHGFPSSLLNLAKKKEAGAVGIRLLYPRTEVYEKYGIILGDDDRKLHDIERIQHIGMTQLATGPSHRLATYPDDVIYEYGRNRRVWNVMGVTGACLMIGKDKFKSVGGFDERIKIAYTDTDLCLDLIDKGLVNIVDNEICLYHLESVTRGDDIEDDSKFKRLNDERAILYKKHPWLINAGDPYSNQSFSHISLDYKPDYELLWDKEQISNEIVLNDYFGKNALAVKEVTDTRLLGNIDSVKMIRKSDDSAVDSYYEIKGWSILHGKNQLRYEKAIIIKQNGRIRIYEASVMYRPDLKDVFPNEKNHLLSGFVCRIDGKNIENISDVKMGVALISKRIVGGSICIYKML